MSTTIDERVVAMRFDNAQFEKRVQATMSTLEKLKQKLNFSGASKGLENINRAAKGVNLSGLGSAAETVGLKFNGMYTMADQALRNITNRVQHTAETMIKAFTIDPLKTGFAEYETQINSVQTILANTQHKGTDIGQVNAALDELNHYADKTIYNFTEMTRNIGTFTAAGVDLDTSVQSIKGIANLAAVSGSTSQQASTAMYQLSQALASGTVKLMDWNSVVNAGMGGEVFQNALIRTSELMGTGAQEAIDMYGTFRDSLTQSGWLTTEVLTETLKQLSGAYTEADLIAQGFTAQEAADIMSLAQTAEDAATKVKTFTQLLDTLKESAQSGWTQTWELFFGDFEQAKEMWSGVSNTLGGLIESMGNRRNEVLEPMLMSNWDQLIKKVNEAGFSTEMFNDILMDVIHSGGASEEWIERTIQQYGSLQKAFQAGAIDSKYLAGAIDALNNCIDDLGDIEPGIDFGDSGDNVARVQQALENMGFTLEEFGVDGKFGKETQSAVKAFQEMAGIEVTGVIDEATLEALREMGGLTGGLIEGWEELVYNIDQMKGREKIIESFRNVWAFLGDILGPIGEAFKEVFPDSLWTKVGSAIDGIHKFTESLQISEGTMQDIKDTFAGVFTVIKVVANVVGVVLGAAFKIATKVVGIFLKIILKVTGFIGKIINGIREFFVFIKTFGADAPAVMAGVMTDLKDRIINGFESINWENIKKWFSEKFESVINVKNKITEWFSGIDWSTAFSTLVSVFTGIGDTVKGVGSCIIEGIKGISWTDIYNTLKDKFVSVSTSVKDFGVSLIAKFKAIDWTKLYTDAKTKIGNLKNTFVERFNTVTSSVKGFGASIVEKYNSIDWGKLYETTKTKIANLKASFIENFNTVSTSVKEFGAGIIEKFKSIDWVKLYDTAKNKILGLKSAFIEKFNSVSETVKGFGNSIIEKVKSVDWASLYATIKEKFNAAVTTIKGFGNNILAGIRAIDWTKIYNFFSTKFTSITNVCKDIGGKISEAFKSINWEGLKNWFGKKFPKLFDKIKKFKLEDILGLDLGEKFAKVGESFNALVTTVKNVFSNIKSIVSNMMSSDGLTADMIAGFINGFASGAKQVWDAVVAFCESVIEAFKETFDMHSPSKRLFDLAVLCFEAIVNAIKYVGGIIWKVATDIFNKVVNIIQNIFNKLKEKGGEAASSGKSFGIAIFDKVKDALLNFKSFVADFDFGKLLNLVPVALLAGLVKKFWDFVNSFSGIARNLGEVFGNLAEVVGGFKKVGKQFGKVLKSFSWSIKADALKNMAIAILVLAGALFVISKIPSDQLGSAAITLIGLAGVLVLLAIAMDKMGGASMKFEKGKFSFDGLKASLLGIGAAILLMAVAVKLIGGMDETEAKQGFIGLAAIVGAIIAFMGVCSLVGKGGKFKDIDKVGTMMKKLAVAILLMILVIKMLKILDAEDAMRGVAFAVAFGLFATALIKVAKSSGNNVSKVGGMMIKMAIAMGLMVGVCKLAGQLSAEEMFKAALFATGFGVFMHAMVKATTGGKNQKILGIGGLVLSLSVSMGLMVGVCKLASKLSYDEMIKGALFAIGFTALVKSMLKILKVGKEEEMAKVAGVILAMSVGIGIMAGVAALIGMVPLEQLIKGVAVVSTLGLVMSAMVKSLRGANSVMGSVIAMTAAIAVMSIAVWALASFPDERKLYGATACLAVLMGAFALMGKSASKLGYAAGTVVVLGVVVAGLAGVLYLLAKNNVTASIDSALALGVLVVAMAGALEILDGVKMVSKNALISMGVMTLVVVALGAAIGLLNKVGLNVSMGIDTAAALSILLIGMSAACLILSAIGPAAVNAVGGAAALSGVILVLGGLIVALGGLVSDIPQLETFLNKGIPVLEKIGIGIGKFVGGLIGGFIGGIGEGITDSLPKISEDLTTFINNFAGVKPTAIESAKLLAGALVTIGVSSLITSIVDLFTTDLSGESSMEKFKTDGVAFFTAMKEITKASKGITVDEESFKAVVTAGTELAKLQSIVEPIGGLADLLLGDDSLGSFGNSVAQFIAEMNLAFSNLYGAKWYDTEAMDAVVGAATSLSTLQATIEPMGGVIEFFTGDDSLGAFGNNVAQFVAEMNLAFANLNGETWYDTEAMGAVVGAATSLSALQATIEPMGGVIEFFTGDDGLGAFGNNVAQFVAEMNLAFANLYGDTWYDTEAMSNLVTAATELGKLQDSLTPIGGVVSWFVGKKDLGTFGTNVGTFADGMGKLKEAISGENAFGQTSVDNMSYAGEALIKLEESLPEKGFFSSKEDLTDFSTHITNFATALTTFATTCAGINKEAINTGINAAGRVRSLINTLATMDTSGVKDFTGIGVGTGAGVDGLMQDIADAIKGFADTIANINIDAVNTSVTTAEKLKTLISNLADLDTSGLENFKIDGIGDSIKTYASSVADIDTTVISSSISIAKRLKNFINSLASIDSSGVGTFKTAISDLSTISVSDIAKSFGGAASKLIEIGGSLMTSLARGIKAKESSLIQTTSSLTIKTYSAIAKKAEIYKAAGVKLMNALIVGLKSKTSSIPLTMNTAISAAVAKVNAKFMSFYNAGKFLGSGLVLGINAKQQAVYDAAYALGQKAVEGEKDGQESQSPSKATKRAGKWFGEGLVIGIDSMSKSVYNAGHDLGETGVRSISSAIGKVSDLVTNGIDSQPTIRPVLDLSDVEAGAGSISGMFGNGLNLGVSTVAAGNVAGYMNNRVQNGTTNDVISAIDKLRKDLGNVGGTHYNVNGITYDDGSNVATAVNALIRAAKIDRRV